MDLLVAGNIISLDLSITQVYEQVWKKSSSQSTNAFAPTLLSSNDATSARDSHRMSVTYRLQGLDGEATEPMIKELDEDREESQDPEVEFADAIQPAEGILLIVDSLTMETNESDNISITQNALTELQSPMKKLVSEKKAKKIVLMFLERLSHPVGLRSQANRMFPRILPYLTYGEPAAMEALCQHFDPYLKNWVEVDQLLKQHPENPKDETVSLQASKQRFVVENFVRVSESMKTSSCVERLKDVILENGITEVAVKHLKDSFAFTCEAGFKGGVLPLLHALEGFSGNLLDTLSDTEGKGDGLLSEKVHGLRNATRDEMRRLALMKRKELLQGLGMRQECVKSWLLMVVNALLLLNQSLKVWKRCKKRKRGWLEWYAVRDTVLDKQTYLVSTHLVNG